jgi:hypothetical protein
MIENHMKREEEYLSHNLEDLIAYLKSQMRLLDLNETSSPQREEAIRLLESLRTVIQARQV